MVFLIPGLITLFCGIAFSMTVKEESIRMRPKT
jgi:hypothetical protein